MTHLRLAIAVVHVREVASVEIRVRVDLVKQLSLHLHVSLHDMFVVLACPETFHV